MTDRRQGTMDRRDVVAAMIKGRGDALIVTGLGSTCYDFGTQELSDAALTALLDKVRAKLDAVGAEDRQELIDLIEAIRDAQVGGDTAALEQGERQLNDLLFYLEI